jgi:NADPH:quinone reductase-like Zn-dependent oxidoreductase
VTNQENAMKAIVQGEYGSPDVLELKDIEKPVVKDGEVLVRVHAASIHIGDWYVMRGVPYVMRPVFGLRRPKVRVPGTDIAGKVEAVGKDVTRFHAGDEVFGWCKGGFAEYTSAEEDKLLPKPVDLTFEQAAAVPTSALTALQALRDHGKVRPGQKVLIIGASGGVGTFAVQIAKSLGAEVTAVCSTRNVDMVRSIGADHVFDYTREDFTEGGRRYDLLLDNVGNRSPSECRRVLNPEALYLSSFGLPERRWFGPMIELLKMTVLSPFASQTMASLGVKRTRERLLALKELIEAGGVTPVIDRTYPLSEVPDAMRYLEEGHARGKVVIEVEHNDTA